MTNLYDHCKQYLSHTLIPFHFSSLINQLLSPRFCFAASQSFSAGVLRISTCLASRSDFLRFRKVFKDIKSVTSLPLTFTDNVGGLLAGDIGLSTGLLSIFLIFSVDLSLVCFMGLFCWLFSSLVSSINYLLTVSQLTATIDYLSLYNYQLLTSTYSITTNFAACYRISLNPANLEGTPYFPLILMLFLFT